MLGITKEDEKDEIMKVAIELKIARIEDGYIAEVSTFKHVPDWFLRLYLFMYSMFCFVRGCDNPDINHLRAARGD
jgi:hypothetical protein